MLHDVATCSYVRMWLLGALLASASGNNINSVCKRKLWTWIKDILLSLSLMTKAPNAMLCHGDLESSIA